MNGAVIIRGEFFREGGQQSRVKYTDYSVEEQRVALRTHVNLFDKIKQQGADLDIYIITQPMTDNFLDIIRDEYGEYSNNISTIHFVDNAFHMSPLANLISEHHKKQEYEFVFIMRPDFIFKDLFYTLFDVTRSKITMMSVCFKYADHHRLVKVGDGTLPRINDTAFFYPKRFVGEFLSKLIYCCHCHEILGDRCASIKLQDVDFFVNTFHDSDSEKDFNPLYRLTGRPECKTWFSRGLIYPDDLLNDKTPM